MTKAQLVKGMREGFNITAKEVEARIGYIDDIVEIVMAAEVGAKVKVGKYITLEKVHEEEKSGVCAGKEWTKAAHDEIRVKRTEKLKNV